MTYHYQDLIQLFNQCFAEKYNTRLVKGDDEPLYLPANETRPYHAIFFAHGFFRSALHECAHWFIAGSKRRLLEDYGYWYEPDGRNQEQQAIFERVEVKPQAIEWILTAATGYPFRVSADNLSGDFEPEPGRFQQAVYEQVLNYCNKGLPARAEQFRLALACFYKTEPRLDRVHFSNDVG